MNPLSIGAERSRGDSAGRSPSIDSSQRVIRVASVPASHVYVRHLLPVPEAFAPDAPVPLPDAPVRSPDVVRLADPDPDDARRSAVSRWWPPVMLDPEWVLEHASEFDVFHLQFGFDARTPDELRALVEALRVSGKPLVYTVHDLRNPHHLARDEHDAQLDVLIPAADGLITLTPGAAAEIERRWRRSALVLPHPHVVDLDIMGQVGAARAARAAPAGDAERVPSTGLRVGVHVKSLRASMNPLPVIVVLAEVVRELPGAVLQVDGHSDVLSPGGARHDAELAGYLAEAAERGAIDLRVHEFFTDEELFGYLGSLDVSVLPYRFGTHSGWLEACRDLGTAVIAPDCGYYADQGPVFSYGHDEGGLDSASLVDAVRLAASRPRPAPIAVADRIRQRDEIAAAHLRLYRSLTA